MFKWIKKHWGKILICVTFLALFASLIIFGSIPGLATAAIGTTFLGIAFPSALTTASTFVQTLVLSSIIATAAPLIVGTLGLFAFGIKAICDCFSNCCGRNRPDQLKQQIDEEILAHNTTQQQQQVSSMMNADGHSTGLPPYQDNSYPHPYKNNNNRNQQSMELRIDPNDLNANSFI